MTYTRQWIAIGGLVVTVAAAAYMVAQLNAQPSPTGDFSNATVAEVRDAQGQIVLRGEFVPIVEDDDDIERKATLAPTGIDSDAAGEAEVEIAKANPANQEIEFSVRNVEPGATFTFAIDGREIATTVADRGGRAEVELEVRSGGTH